MLIEKLYLDPFLRESEMDLQLLGQAIHLARMRDKRYIAIKKPTAEPDQKMCARFAFEEVPGKSDWIRLDLYINGRPQAI